MNETDIEQIKKELWKRFQETSDNEINRNGYVDHPEKNLLPDVNLEDFAEDFRQGSGNELDEKFCAVHSSSALAANTFGPFRKNCSRLELLGQSHFHSLKFEKQCPTGLRGTPPNLDLLIENEEYVIGVESKFLEYFSPKKPKFSASYCKEKLPQAEDNWMNLLEELRNSEEQYFDSAQLVKHYLGLRNQPSFQDRKIILFYLFWEPQHWQKIDVCCQHRNQVMTFADGVTGSDVDFIWLSYPELWTQWKDSDNYLEHVNNLGKRYVI